MKISIYNSFKKKQHKDIAYLQDQITDIVYNIFPNIIFHGGTSIWRCYNGNRFSEYLNFYLLKQKNIKQKLQKEITKKKLNLIKFKETSNLIFSKISLNKIIVQLEITLLNEDDEIITKAIASEYNNTDGSTITIFCLSEKDLLFKKANAFLNRRLIRDIYDVYFLSNLVKLTDTEKKELHKMILNFKEPIDEPNLKTIVYRGAIPSYFQMLNNIKRRL